MPDSCAHVLPSVLSLRDHLLLILGRANTFQPHLYVDHTLIVPQVILAAGFDPDHLEQYGDPALGWRRTGWETPVGFDRRVLRCFLDGFQKQKHPYTERGARKGYWGLTDSGVALALDLDLKARAKAAAAAVGVKRPNITSRFLDRRILETGGLEGTLWNKLRATVRNRLPISAVTSQVDDHIQNCFLRLISRDALKKKLAAGEVITNEKLAFYAMNAGITDIRNDGTEPVSRELYGARTERERKQNIVMGPANDDRVVWQDSEGEKSGAWLDLADTDSSMSAESTTSQLQFNSIWAQVQEAVRKKKPHAGDRYVNVLRLKASGLTVKEIAESEGVSPFRAASLMAEARRVVREASAEGLISGVV